MRANIVSILLLSIILMQLASAPATKTKKESKVALAKPSSPAAVVGIHKTKKPKNNGGTKATSLVVKKPTKTKSTSNKKPKKATSKPEITNKNKTPSKSIRIVNGQVTSIKKYPYMIQLYHRGSFICGGTLVSKRFVVTAAHCFASRQVRQYLVKAGATTLSGSGVKRMVSKIMIPKTYNQRTTHKDVAVLKLAHAISGANIVPIRLNTQQLKAGAILKISGWGLKSENGQISNKLRVAKVPVISKQKCKTEYRNVQQLTRTMFCAAKPKTDACQGDSGGPAVGKNGRLVGIVSWGIGCARRRYPGVYTSVRSVLSFIRKAMKQ